ncbi:MAG: hypothetical protein Q4B54_10065 [Coriobacteriales bacterium]|nr:hypothetical protein [Coriobacteriales bacterium]
MKARGTWLVSMMIAVSMVFLGLTGCSALGDPSTTEDLLVRYAANPNNMNFEADANVDLALSLSGFRTDVPVTAHVAVAGAAAHGTATVDLSAIDAQNRSYEFYIEQDGTNYVAFLRMTNDANAKWSRLEIDCTFSFDIPALVKILSESRFLLIAYDEDEAVHYELSMPAETIVSTLFGMGDISATFTDLNEQTINDALGTSRLHLRFNKDCLVRSIALSCNFTYTDKEIIPVPVKVGLDLSCVMDKYGTVDASSVEVPQEVRKDATIDDDPFGIKAMSNDLMSAAN